METFVRINQSYFEQYLFMVCVRTCPSVNNYSKEEQGLLEVRRRCQVLCDWRNRGLSVVMWSVGTKLKSSAREKMPSLQPYLQALLYSKLGIKNFKSKNSWICTYYRRKRHKHVKKNKIKIHKMIKYAKNSN